MMKRSLMALYGAILMVVPLMAQNDEVAPEPRHSTYEFTVDGLKVIYRYVPNEIISMAMGFRGGTARYSKAEEGIESLALQTAVASGTKDRPRDRFHDALDAYGIRISASATYDYSTLSLQCLREYRKQGLENFAAVLLSPYFDTLSFRQTREQLVSAARQALSSPDAYVRRVSIQETFKGYDYEKVPAGTPEALKALRYEKVRNFYFNNLLDRANMVLVVVGDIDEDEVKGWVRTALRSLPTRHLTFKTNVPKQIAYSDSKLKVYPREEMATYYYRGITGAPPKGSRWEYPMMLGFSILDDRFFVEIRTKRNLSYAPAAYMARAMKVPYGILYVSTTDPSAAAAVMIRELEKIKKEGFSADELRDKKQVFLTYHYMGEESNGSIAGSLLRAEMTAGGWRQSVLFNEKVQKVTLPEMNMAFRKYIRGIRWYYVGDPSAIKDRSVFERVVK